MPFANTVLFTAGSSGTVDFSDGTAVAGYRNLAGAGLTDEATYSYRAESINKAEWENGLGTYDDGGVLERTTIHESSNSGNAVDFTAPPRVMLTPLADDLFSAAERSKLVGIEAGADVTDAGNVGAAIHGATAKTTPVDADTVPLIDSAASNVLKKLSWTNIKATLKTYFDTLYQPLATILTAIAALGSNGLIVRTGSGTVAARSIAVTSSTGLSVSNGDGVSGNPTLAGVDATTSAKGVSEFATAAEYRTGTDTARSLVVSEVWGAAALAVLSDGGDIAVDLATGINFGGASNAPLAIGGNRNLSAPSNLKTGQSGVLWFGASGSTRTLTLNAAWLLMDGVEAGPYSITTSQILGVAYVVRASVVYVTAILRRAA